MIKTQSLPLRRLVDRSHIFYGWVVWAVATLGMIASAPGQSFTVSLFFDHFIDDLNMTRTTVSLLYSGGTFLAALTLTWVGRQIDRHGNRKVGLGLHAVFALALAGLSVVSGPVLLFILFYGIRMLGHGALMLNNSTVIAQWFRQRRGRVMSLSLVLFSLFQSVYIPWLQGMIDALGWRTMWIVLAVIVAGVSLPITWLLMRDRPEDFGLQPDGQTLTDAQAAAVSAAEENWTLAEARQTMIFWVFMIGRAMAPAVGAGLTIHQISLFAELGHGPQVVAETYSLFAIGAAGVALGAGVLMDRIRPNLVLALQLLALIAALLMALIMTEPWLLVVYAGAKSLTMGIGGVFDGAVWANLFGRQHQGAIRGFAATSLVIGTASGPILFGLSYDWFGSYAPILWLCIILAAAPLILSFFVTKPPHPPGAGGETLAEADAVTLDPQ
ncbi:MAG: MFS transporter, partial [Chloroflexi bacterium]|nr:MFS transporter [Chloroflexota bacterium]